MDTCIAFNDVIRNDGIDAVVISTPAETHYQLAREALLADKHVYVEKPLVLDEKEARTIIQIAKERNRILMVGHLLQYHLIFMKLKELTLSGELGRINYIYSNRLKLGEIRMAVFNDTKQWEDKLWLYPHKIKGEHNIPVPDKADPEKVDVPQKEPLRQECKHFLNCITTGLQPMMIKHA